MTSTDIVKPKRLRKGRNERQAEEERVLDMVVGGKTHRQIAVELGVSPRTVSYRLESALARKMPVTVNNYREVMAEQIDHLFQANVIRLQAGDVGAIADGLRIIDRKAKLFGIDAPVQAEITVVEVTAQERELSALLEQAKRDQQMKEAEMTKEEEHAN